jgi:MtN3 and saliva related transmembrane protein
MADGGVELLGAAAGILTTFSAAPQLLTSYRRRDVKSFDLRFMLMLFTGLSLWTVYGWVIGSISITLFNFIGCLLWLPLVLLKARERLQDR